MSNKLAKTVIGALVAIALAVAVSYGLISQQTADNIQTQTNQTLSNGQSAPTAAPTAAPQQQVPPAPAPTTSAAAPAPQGPNAQTQAPAGPAAQSPAPAPRP